MTRHPRLIFLPTALTLARLMAVPVIIAQLLSGNDPAAFVIFVLAGLSDAVDGALARRLDARTEIGAYLDPIADKALMISVYALLGWRGLVPDWLVIVVIFRDVLIMGGVILFHTLKLPVTMAPLRISKINSLVQIVFAAWILACAAFNLADPDLGTALVVLVAVTTSLSGVFYVMQSIRHLSGHHEHG